MDKRLTKCIDACQILQICLYFYFYEQLIKCKEQFIKAPNIIQKQFNNNNKQ